MPDFILSPLTFALFLALALSLSWRRLPRLLRYLGVTFEVVFLTLMAPVGANALVWMIESRVPAATSCTAPAPDTIVVLSGGTDRPPDSPGDYDALTATSLRRLLAGVALWRRSPGARLVIAGGGWRVPDSVLMAGLAERMGVPGTSIEMEEHSHTTWENARDVAALSPHIPRRIWLVSSKLHLPRALGAFRAWGFDPCAWPAGSLFSPPEWNPGYFMPQSSSLDKVDPAIHELLGGIVYRGLEWKRRRNGAQVQPGATRSRPNPAATAAGREATRG
jgi:uncharacterized SAM-binding protein YcdF (DUF218 family)